MGSSTEFKYRLRQLFGPDGPMDVARRLQIAGTPVTPQAVYKWLEAGTMSEESLIKVCRAYDVSPAWLRYGSGAMRTPSSAEQAAAELVSELPGSLIERTYDYLAYQIEREPALFAAEDRAHYIALIDRIRHAMHTPSRKAE